MASNNNLNSNLTNPTILGTATLTGNATIGSSSAGAFTLACGAANFSWTIGNFNILTGTGNLNISNSSTSSTALGSTSGGDINITSSGVTIVSNSGTGTTTFTKQGAGNISFTSSSANMTIGSATTTNLGASSVPTSIQIGNNGSSFNTTIGSTSNTTTNIITGSGVINIGTAAVDKTITIGSTTSGSILVLSTGTNGINFPTVSVTGSSVTLAVGINYIMNNGSLITATLPTTAALGTTIKIVGLGSGGWTIAQNASQVIKSSSSTTTTGTGGTLSSGGRYDCVELVCGSANTSWTIKDSAGTLTFV